MYSEKEARLARKYNHMIPSVKYRGEIIGYPKVALKKLPSLQRAPISAQVLHDIVAGNIWRKAS
jgi:hypothetical protein